MPPSRLEQLRELFYPGTTSLGVSPLDGTVQFYTKVVHVCPSGATVLDFGAGRGSQLERAPSWKRQLLLLQPNAHTGSGLSVSRDVDREATAWAVLCMGGSVVGAPAVRKKIGRSGQRISASLV